MQACDVKFIWNVIADLETQAVWVPDSLQIPSWAVTFNVERQLFLEQFQKPPCFSTKDLIAILQSIFSVNKKERSERISLCFWDFFHALSVILPVLYCCYTCWWYNDVLVTFSYWLYTVPPAVCWYSRTCGLSPYFSTKLCDCWWWLMDRADGNSPVCEADEETVFDLHEKRDALLAVSSSLYCYANMSTYLPSRKVPDVQYRHSLSAWISTVQCNFDRLLFVLLYMCQIELLRLLFQQIELHVFSFLFSA
jgi:hypothetical protein